MSLFSALSVSLSGLQATTIQLQTAANNIANAGQAGYTRKTAVQGSTSMGQEGGGTKIIGYTRASNETLLSTLNTSISSSSKLSTQSNYLEQVQTLLGSNYGDNPPISEAMSAFASAWRQLEASPESSVQQSQTIQTATNLAAQIKSIATAVESLDRQAHADIKATLSELNTDLANIAAINLNISSAMTSGQSYGDLQDQRDQLVQKVAANTDIIVMQRPLGAIAVYTSTGYSLVDGQSQNFTYNGVDVTSPLNPAQSLNDVLAGGKLQAVVKFRADTYPAPASTDPSVEVIRKLRSQMDGIVSAFTNAVSGLQQTFANAYGETASVSVQTNCIDFTSKYSGTIGNGISVNIEDELPLTTHKATISVPGQADEVFTNIAGTGSDFWNNLATAVNAGSRLVTAEAKGGTADPILNTPVTLTGGVGKITNGNASVILPSNAITFNALTSGTAGNGISVTISFGTNANSFKATISCQGQTTEVFDNVDASGGAATFWTNLTNAINNGNASHVAPSLMIMATKGTSTSLPVAGATSTYRLAEGNDELQSSFFVGTDRTTIAVNSSLLNGTKTIKTSSSSKTAATFSNASRNFVADGINVVGSSYETMTTSILTVFQQSARSISQLSDTASKQQDYLTARLSNETGVNIDSETLSLTALQNAYAASAHVLTIIRQMFEVLEKIT